MAGLDSGKRRIGRRPRALDLDRIVALRDAGWDLRAIAAELGCGVMTISRRLETVTPGPLLRNAPGLEVK